jgi:hypothetical protein
MMNSKGEVLGDDGYRSVVYVHGAGNIVPYLERPLEGSKPSENRIFSVSLNKKEYTFDVVVDNIRLATEKELALGQPEINGCGCDGEC